MNRKTIRFTIALMVLAALILATFPVQAAPLPINGKHDTLNIIGVDKGKNPNATGWSNGARNTIFVPKTGVTNISVSQNASFAVLDAYGMDGTAGFQLGPGFYEVYARAGGKSGQWVMITPQASYQDTVSINGTQTFVTANITLSHSKKPAWERFTGFFFSTVTLQDVVTNETTNYTNSSVFTIGNLSQYWWSYDNHGQSPVEIRLYPVKNQPIL